MPSIDRDGEKAGIRVAKCFIVIPCDRSDSSLHGSDGTKLFDNKHLLANGLPCTPIGGKGRIWRREPPRDDLKATAWA
jgi:hypothetical protein